MSAVATSSGLTEQGAPSVAARYLNPFRLTTYLLVLYCVGHTWGALLTTPPFGAASDAVLSSMKGVHFNCQGSDCTWFGFYVGFGLLVSIFFLLSAAIAWFLGGLGPREQRALAPLTWALFLSHAGGAVLAWAYFFSAPRVFATVIAALLGWQCWKLLRSAPPGVNPADT